MDFIFDGKALSDFGYVIAYENAVSENTVVSGMSYQTIKPALSDISHKVAHEYSENLSTTFLIMKNYCVYDNQNMTDDDISEMTKWLVRKQYKWFRYIKEDDITDEVWWKVQNTVEKVIEGGHVIGLSITVNADAPYGYTREVNDNWDSTAGSTHSIVVHSDEEGYIYPDVVIKVGGSGNLVITNTYENRTTVINNVTNNEIIRMDGGDVQQIISSRSAHDISSDFNYRFLRLCNEYGNYKNGITTNLPCNISLSYRGIRKVGL